MRAHPASRRRRGVALLAALWLVVVMTAAAMQFASVTRERRALGLASMSRTREHAALLGALASVQGRLQMAQRNAAADPWRLPERNLPDLVAIGDEVVTVRATDLGAVVNVNRASEQELTVLFSAVLRDAALASRLAQRIADWRDEDSLSRADGAEASSYRRAGHIVLPANGDMRSLDELSDVLGMTPDIADRVRPYLTADGDARRINLNAAPEPVLRVLPGITTPMIATILALRSAGRRVESFPALVTAVRGRGRSDAASAEYMATVRALTENATIETRDIAVEFTVREEPGERPARLTAGLHRNDEATSTIRWLRW